MQEAFVLLNHYIETLKSIYCYFERGWSGSYEIRMEPYACGRVRTLEASIIAVINRLRLRDPMTGKALSDLRDIKFELDKYIEHLNAEPCPFPTELGDLGKELTDFLAQYQPKTKQSDSEEF